MWSSWYDDLFDDPDDDYRSPVLDDRGAQYFTDGLLSLDPWFQAGFSEEEAYVYAGRGLTVAEATSARAAGFTPQVMGSFLDAGYEVEDLIEADTDFDVSQLFTPVTPDPAQMLLAAHSADPTTRPIELVATSLTLREVLGDELGRLFPEVRDKPMVTARRRAVRPIVADGQLDLFSEPTPQLTLF